MSERGFLDVQTDTLFADGFQYEMDVRVRFICMQGERISVLTPEFFPREVSNRAQHLLGWRARRHGEHELVDDLGRLPTFGGGEFGLPADLVDIQIPIVKECFSNPPLKTLAVVAFEFEFSVSA